MQCALRTASGTCLTAVNGGGIGGPNHAHYPVHRYLAARRFSRARA